MGKRQWCPCGEENNEEAHHCWNCGTLRAEVEKPTDDESAKLADALSLSAAGVEDGLLAAEATARQGGQEDLGEVLARVHMLWSIGGINYARGLLDEARDLVLTGLRNSTDS